MHGDVGVARRVRAGLRRRRPDLEMLLLRLAGRLPIHRLRLALLRAFGATVGPEAIVYGGFVIRAPRGLAIGERSIIGDGAILDARGGLTIGSDVNFSTAVNVWTAQHDWQSPDFAYQKAPVVIGDHAWVSTRVTILPGVTIGEGAVIAAGSVVAKDVPPWTLAAGAPARPIKDRPPGMTYRLGGPKTWWW